uniref:Ribulose-phosphate 3-epimerase n=1 Tax=Candidatus Kentrum sp. TC TaxID=2126339 RepID=A0A450YUK5_9GAMM|nr:MAG: ribulose-phosphate 3-epimerase [Candidatus Kentron sp. TC]VFK55700.1 MAG: ribulose-phosphate 3-epimerase [Candidatus Kentron sp. TC]
MFEHRPNAQDLSLRTIPILRSPTLRTSPNGKYSMKNYWIAPSILSADFARLGQDIDAVLAAGADIIHFDVMDNHYVPNLTVGPLVCKALRDHGVTAPLDIHLLVSPVDRIIPDFAKAGATYITFHPEASPHLDRSLQLIRDSGCKSGLVFNPATPLNYLQYVMGKIDMVLLMSVNPGFGGQSFLPSALPKLREARRLIDESGFDIRLEIDGGIKIDNIRESALAGADTFVSGTGIFGSPNYRETIDAMRSELAKAGATT